MQLIIRDLIYRSPHKLIKCDRYSPREESICHSIREKNNNFTVYLCLPALMRECCIMSSLVNFRSAILSMNICLGVSAFLNFG